MVTSTESKAQAYRVGLPRPTCGVYVAYAKSSYRYGIKGTGLSCRATASSLWCLYRFREKSYRYGNKGIGQSCRATAATPPPPPPTHPAAAGSVQVGRGGLRRAGGPCRGGLPRTMPCAARRGAPANRAYAGRYGALVGPAAAASHAQSPAPAAVARPPTAPTQAVGVGRGRGLVAVYGLFRSIWLLSGFGSPHA